MFADVYERLTPPNRKPSFLNMVATQLVSGVWHGVFAGYWLFFATSAFMFQASRLVYRYEQNWPPALRRFLPWKLLKIVASALVLDYAGTSFMVLTLKDSWAVWRSVYFFGHAIVFILLLVGAVMPPRRKPQKTEPESAAKGSKGAAKDGAEGVLVTATAVEVEPVNGVKDGVEKKDD